MKHETPSSSTSSVLEASVNCIILEREKMCLDQKENFLPFGSVASLSSSSPRSLAPASTSSPLAVPAKQFSQIIKMQQLFSTFTAEQPRDVLWAD